MCNEQFRHFENALHCRVDAIMCYIAHAANLFLIVYLDDNYNLRPSSIPDAKVCNANKEEYLFFDCINNIHEVS